MFGASSQPESRGSSRESGLLHNVHSPAPASPRALSPRNAETLHRMIESEIVPRLLMAHRTGATPPSLIAATARELTEQDVNAFVQYVTGADDALATGFVRDIIASGTPIEAVYLDLLAPTARRLGELWDDDECDFVEVTVALGRMQRVLRDLSQVFMADAERSDTAGHVLLSCVPGEQHTLGLIMVAEFLLRDGFRVLVGSPFSEADLLTLVRTEWFDVIGFSAGCDSRLSQLKREVLRVKAASRNPNLKVLVGGHIFSLEPELVGRVGADAWARDAREAPAVARSLLADAPSVAPSATVMAGRGELSEAIRRQ